MEKQKVKKDIKLTNKEVDQFNSAVVCGEACRRLIEEVVKHFERNQLHVHELWRATEEKYNLDAYTDEWQYDIKKGAITYLGPAGGSKLKKAMEDFSIRKLIREEIRAAFELERKK